MQFLTWDELAIELGQHKVGGIMTVEQQEAVPAQRGTFCFLLSSRPAANAQFIVSRVKVSGA